MRRCPPDDSLADLPEGAWGFYLRFVTAAVTFRRLLSEKKVFKL
jgi:hypothetical protein